MPTKKTSTTKNQVKKPRTTPIVDPRTKKLKGSYSNAGRIRRISRPLQPLTINPGNLHQNRKVESLLLGALQKTDGFETTSL